MTSIGGIILCGGQSSRMGRPKAWLPFGNELMLQRVVRIVGEVVRPVVVVAASEQELPALQADVLVVRDEVEGRGPLQGLAAGLTALQGRCDAAYLSGCDVPFLKPAFIRRMIELLGDNTICVANVGGFRHPLAAIYRLEVASVVQRLLQGNRPRPLDLFAEVPTRVVEAHELRNVDPGFQSLRNLNTADDYFSALCDAGFTPAEIDDPDHGV